MLDVHIADSFDAATRNEPIIRIDLDVYTAFFSDRIDLTETCPTLQRMNDYFSDCTFAGHDLQNLVMEIDTIAQKLAPDSPHRAMITQLREACRTAINNDDSIFVLCD